jgi:hypothetical protein
LHAAAAEMLADALEQVMQGKQCPQKAREYLAARKIQRDIANDRDDGAAGW